MLKLNATVYNSEQYSIIGFVNTLSQMSKKYADKQNKKLYIFLDGDQEFMDSPRCVADEYEGLVKDGFFTAKDLAQWQRRQRIELQWINVKSFTCKTVDEDKDRIEMTIESDNDEELYRLFVMVGYMVNDGHYFAGNMNYKNRRTNSNDENMFDIDGDENDSIESVEIVGTDKTYSFNTSSTYEYDDEFKNVKTCDDFIAALRKLLNQSEELLKSVQQ